MTVTEEAHSVVECRRWLALVAVLFSEGTDIDSFSSGASSIFFSALFCSSAAVSFGKGASWQLV